MKIDNDFIKTVIVCFDFSDNWLSYITILIDSNIVFPESDSRIPAPANISLKIRFNSLFLFKFSDKINLILFLWMTQDL